MPCVSGSTNQYQCWDANGMLGQGPQVCISTNDKCDPADSCDCPWCDDQWNCPSFTECQQNGGFLCSKSFFPGTNELWACIPGDWKCDGVWDCPSGEDESSEYCNVGKCAQNHNLTYWYQCSDTGRCITINSVGNGEIDCVNGEDENPMIIRQIINAGGNIVPVVTAPPSRSAEHHGSTTSPPPTPSPTKTQNFPFGIDLVIRVSGIGLAEVCFGTQARFAELEQAVANILGLSPDHVVSTCQRRSFTHIRLLHAWVSGDSESSDSGEKSVFSSHNEQVTVKLYFNQREQYLRMLTDTFRISHHLKEDSSSQEWNVAHTSAIALSNQIQAEVSALLDTQVQTKIIRITGTSD